MENIVTDYPWTTTQGDYRNEAPQLFATSYSINNNAMLEAIKTYAKSVEEGSVTAYYKNMHGGTTASERYVFPFFNDEVRSFNNSWGDSYVGSTNGSNTGVDLLGNIKAVAETVLTLGSQANTAIKDSPGELFEPPKFYQYSQDEGPVTVNFVLINTTEAGHTKNYDLVKKLIKDNRFTREEGSPFLVTPPQLWSLTIPGYRAIQWASCGVTVSLMGSRRYVGAIIIPEGYNISLTFTPLYTEPSNYMDSTTSFLL